MFLRQAGRAAAGAVARRPRLGGLLVGVPPAVAPLDNFHGGGDGVLPEALQLPLAVNTENDFGPLLVLYAERLLRNGFAVSGISFFWFLKLRIRRQKRIWEPQLSNVALKFNGCVGAG